METGENTPTNLGINMIRAHAEHLRVTDETKYNKMMAELTLYRQSAYFYQTLCNPKKFDYSLHDVRSIVRDIMCDYMNFTARNFRENSMPSLPVIEKRDSKSMEHAVH